eukprot:CAMPEP_0170144186 /NCGR_PEP_ID=MMETSP0033_2-20121228/13339_1 /TAXON_ID=195969 /ORGANISM="Dolichomastix tenuilepis, Strain CCMP3274" /LENGTH=603 /DNA_ID=CAMNT_0010380671 /DNA_START=14 /DNA_END=1825 /DNA_ORIENTATION=+
MSAEAEAEVADATGEQPMPRNVAFPLLQMLKTAQEQHGLRHDDYGRYRQYCARRLRRLHKALKFTHGKDRYQARVVEARMCTDSRWLEMLLINAERAWAAAMEAKGEDEQTRERRQIAQRKLRRAAKVAAELARIAGEVGEPRAALEAEAYSSWMGGVALMENELKGAWDGALALLDRARRVWEQLSRVGDLDHAAMCRSRLQQLEPLIRYCRYKRGGGSSADNDEPMQEAEQELSAKMEAVLAEERARFRGSEGVSLEWRGTALVVRNEQTRLMLVQGIELAGQATAAGAGAEKRLALFDKAFMRLTDAQRSVRSDLATMSSEPGSASEQRGAEERTAQLQVLDAALGAMLIDRTVERNELLVAANKAAHAGSRPEELVRLYDTLLGNLAELQETVQEAAGGALCSTAQGAELLASIPARAAVVKAQRSLAIARGYALAARPLEAAALCLRAKEHAAKAQSGGEEETLKVAAEAAKLRAIYLADAAEASLSERAEAERSMQGLNLAADGSGAGPAPPKTLLESLDEFAPKAGVKGEAPRLVPVPLPPQPVPAAPIFLDTAFNLIAAPPSVAHRTAAGADAGAKQSAVAGLASRIFGWGGGKK